MIKENIAKIHQQVQDACVRAKRDPFEITLVAITKNRGVEEIKEAIVCGITDIGENRVQEALLKYGDMRYACLPDRQAISDKPIKWHMAGHLQTNKVKDAVKIFDLIHSVDSLRLAQEIDKQARKINKIQGALLEIKTSPEETKYGISMEEAIGVAGQVAKLKNIRLSGLMTIAPLARDPEEARPYFKILKGLFDKINSLSNIDHRLSVISMGMTDDFVVAIEEGATMIRLGRAIFESQPDTRA